MGFNYFQIYYTNLKITLPCDKSGECPYEYDLDPERDIEGMPFIDDDSRSCPVCGHICPEFMEDLGLSLEDLHIRAVIHCGNVAYNTIEKGEVDKDHPKYDIYMDVIANAESIRARYPIEKFPLYYE